MVPVCAWGVQSPALPADLLWFSRGGMDGKAVPSQGASRLAGNSMQGTAAVLPAKKLWNPSFVLFENSQRINCFWDILVTWYFPH